MIESFNAKTTNLGELVKQSFINRETGESETFI
jgi:hypothetical protein